MHMRDSGYKIGRIELLTKNTEYQKNNKSYILLYVKKGVGMYLLDGRLSCLNEGDLLFFPPGASFSFVSSDLGDEYNESVDAVVFRFGEQWLAMLLQVFGRYGGTVLGIRETESVMSVVGPKWFKISSLLGRLYDCSPHEEATVILDIMSMLAETSDMFPLCGAVSSDQQDAQMRVERISKYIDCHFLDRITLDDIASYAGMNRTYFCLFFKKHFGEPLMDYINGRKVDAACEMLLRSDAGIAEISARCGFKTVTYFNRVFKRIKGVSPGNFRLG